MIIDYDPDDYETIREINTCAFHKKHPKMLYAGCTCSASYSQRKKTDLETKENKLKEKR